MEVQLPPENYESTREAIEVKVPGGTVIAEYVQGPLGSDPIVIAHGGPGCPDKALFESLIPLSKKHAIVYFDQLGCGTARGLVDGSIPNEELYTLKRYTDEFAAVCEKAKELAQSKHAIGVGHSWGSMLVTQTALEGKASFSRLVLSGPCLNSNQFASDLQAIAQNDPRFTCLLDRPVEMTDDEYEARRNEFYGLHLCPQNLVRALLDDPEANFDDIYSVMWGSEEWTCTGNMRDIDLTQGLHKIEVPVLVTVGETDEVPVSTAQELSRQFKNGRCVETTGGHFPHLYDPGKYADTLDSFLSEQ